jgi:AcrR family transcriptional regulator
VITAALDIVDRDGVEGLTMRALGRQLDVDPMAAYHHVPNKTAILDGVVEAVWSELVLLEPSDEPWQTQLDRIARSMRTTLRRHPNALPIMATRPNLSTPGLRLTDRALGVLLDAGLPAEDALAFVNAAAEFILGHALTETAQPIPDIDANIAAAIDDPTTSEQLPHLSHTLDHVDLATVTADRIFDTGITTLINGLEHRLDELSHTADAATPTDS